MTERPPLDELLSLMQATVAAEGITTAPGAAAGNSFIDAGLIGVGANSFLSMLAVLYPGQPRLVDSFDITAFNNATGEVTLSTAYKGVAAAIPAGVPYKIVTFRFVPAEVAALQADVGDASASTLGSLYGILGNPAQTFLAMIGYEGALSLANKLTAARAALLDQITALRMAELDAANIPADVDELKASKGRQLFSMDFWSAPQEEVAIPAVAATLTLPIVTVADLPAGVTVVRAIAMVKFRMIENINAAANKLDGATVALTSQVIQVQDDTPGTWRDAIKFVDDQFGLAASTREGGDVLIGDTDIAIEVDGNDGYNFQYLLAKADLLGINWNDVQCGLRIWYSV